MSANFQHQPIGHGPVNIIPGINQSMLAKFNSKGFKYAYQLVGKYLCLGEDPDVFKHWLAYKIGLTDDQVVGTCAINIAGWINNFIDKPLGSGVGITGIFMLDPINDKKIGEIPGVDPETAEAFSKIKVPNSSVDIRYVYARQLLGEFLVLQGVDTFSPEYKTPNTLSTSENYIFQYEEFCHYGLSTSFRRWLEIHVPCMYKNILCIHNLAGYCAFKLSIAWK